MNETLFLLGATGFAGNHFRTAAAAAGFEVVAADRHGDQPHCDLLDPRSVERAVAEVEPGVVVNLAGSASVAASFHDPAGAFQVNAVGAVALLNAVAKHAPQAQVLCVSSGEIYGAVAAGDLPATEDLPARPANPYAGSKAAMEVACDMYARAQGLRIAVVRAFNHTGPGQSDAFAASSFARQIAEAELGGDRGAVLRAGNLDVIRDFTDVRDIVRAYLAIVERGLTGIFNACSGQGTPVGRLFDLLAASARMPVCVDADPARMRSGEVEVAYGSPERLECATGWRREIQLEQTMTDLLDWWRDKLALAT